MARDAENQAKQTYQQSQALTKDSEAKTNDLYNQLHSTYTSEIANPKGFDPADLNAMNTAGQQSLGGGLAAAKGEAATKAASNRNSGSFAPVLDESVRDAGRTNSENAIKTQEADALMREQHRQEGMAGESGLYGSQNNDVLSSLGLQNQSTDTQIKAGQSGWFQNMLGLMNATANVGKAASGLGVHVPGCWIAIALYGAENYKTKVLRQFIFNEWKTPCGYVFSSLYWEFGERIAKLVKKYSFVRGIAKFIFDRLYLKAERELGKCQLIQTF